MTVEKKDLDWGSLDFGYHKTDYSFEAHWKDGEWDEGGLTTDHDLHLSECAGIFHYCQEVFEGLKAYTTEDGSIVCFRPDMNAERMFASAERLEMPGFPKDKFIEAVKAVVSANAAWVPPFGSGATLYVRPFMIGSGEVIGVAPAPEYTFRILVTPVGPYFKGGLKPIKLRVSEYDRAAPHGTGNIKAGLNYAMSLRPTMEAHRGGYAENLYLDSESRTYIEETGGANVLFVKEDGTLVVPKSHTDSILPSITRRSLVQVAKDLGMTVDERYVTWDPSRSDRQQGQRRRPRSCFPCWLHRDRPGDEEASRNAHGHSGRRPRGQARLGLQDRLARNGCEHASDPTDFKMKGLMVNAVRPF